jgi:HlyD family secretion protein
MTQLFLKQKEPELEVNIPKSRHRVSPKLLIPIGLLVAGIAGTSWYLLSPPQVQPLQVSGRIEGYETNIGAKFAGRIDYIAVREGDEVRQGQVIVRMDDDELQAQLQGATARLNAVQQQERQARLQIEVLESQIKELQLNWQQARGDARGRVLQAESALASSVAQLSEAKATLQQAKSELALAKTNRDRYAQLVSEGAIPQQQFDQTQTAWETAQATVQARQSSVESAQKLVQAAQGQLQQAKMTELNPDIRTTQLQALRTQLAQAHLKLAAAQADVMNARAAKQEIQSKIADLKIISPIDGVVTARSVEPGAVVTTGKTLLTVINPDEVYLRGFIPEGEIANIKVGQPAKVFLDSRPDRPLSAKISAIDTQASFTPENIYFKEDRVKQVFGVKIRIDRPDGLAKPGMPADAEIVTQSND